MEIVFFLTCACALIPLLPVACTDLFAGFLPEERLELIMQRCTTATTPVRQLNAVSRAALDRAVDVLLMKRALARLPAPQLVWVRSDVGIMFRDVG